MALPNVFEKETAEKIIARIEAIGPDSQPEWGEMSADQMLAHCNVTYELAFENKHPKPGGFARLMLKMFVKNQVVSEKPYSRNGRTGPQFLIADRRNLEAEKARLIGYVRKAQALGAAHFEGRESHSFGPLTAMEWNNMFYKHLDHHLRQFGA